MKFHLVCCLSLPLLTTGGLFIIEIIHKVCCSFYNVKTPIEASLVDCNVLKIPLELAAVPEVGSAVPIN